MQFRVVCIDNVVTMFRVPEITKIWIETTGDETMLLMTFGISLGSDMQSCGLLSLTKMNCFQIFYIERKFI